MVGTTPGCSGRGSDMKALIGVLILAVVCLAGAVGYLVWDRQADNDSEPATSENISSPTETTAALDAPRYTQEEVVAKIMNHGFDFETNGETEHLTVTESLIRTVCGGPAEPRPATVLDAGLFMIFLQEGAHLCESETSAKYEGNGRWTISIAFKATQPMAARFSFREDTGEVIALNSTARGLIGL